MTTQPLHKILIVLILTWPVLAITPKHIELMAFWNVGQGQWITYIQNDSCQHFDFGGEKNLFYKTMTQKIQIYCQSKLNHLYLSHFDEDHFSMLNIILQTKKQCIHIDLFKRLVLLKNLPHLFKKNFDLYSKKLMQLPICPQAKGSLPITLYNQVSGQKNSNDQSLVVLIEQLLIPGDSTVKQEKIWQHHSKITSQNLIPGQTPTRPRIQLLSLGHHGSQTSTSEALLNQLPYLTTAVAQARKKKYGHPHRSVRIRLKSKNISLLQTEIWGHIIFEWPLSLPKDPIKL